MSDLAKRIQKVAQRESGVEPDTMLPDLSLSMEQHRANNAIREAQQKMDHANDLHDLRATYANRIFGAVTGWLVLVMAVILASGFNVFTSFQLSDAVLIAFISSTTVSVLGICGIVAKWLFPMDRK